MASRSTCAGRSSSCRSRAGGGRDVRRSRCEPPQPEPFVRYGRARASRRSVSTWRARRCTRCWRTAGGGIASGTSFHLERLRTAREQADAEQRERRDARVRCSRTARATSTGTSWSSARGSCRAMGRRRRSRSGSGASGPGTCCRDGTDPVSARRGRRGRRVRHARARARAPRDRGCTRRDRRVRRAA
jgi:hypothetical protein